MCSAQASHTIYVADTGNHTIRTIDSTAAVTTLAGTASTSGYADGTVCAATFNGPAGISVDSSGNLYITDTINDTVRKATSAGVVTTLAGTWGVAGSTDATGNAALFSGPVGSSADSSDNIYVADTQNSTIRKITSTGVVSMGGWAARCRRLERRHRQRRLV